VIWRQSAAPLSAIKPARPCRTAEYCFDPVILPGNIENFVGVAQVPIGIAGPIHIRGEHAHP